MKNSRTELRGYVGISSMLSVPPTYFLLTDQPFQRGPLGNDQEAWLGFPISSDVLLYMNHHPNERWLAYPMKRPHVIDYGRTLVKLADRYVAAPQEDKDLTNMIQRLRPPTGSTK